MCLRAKVGGLTIFSLLNYLVTTFKHLQDITLRGSIYINPLPARCSKDARLEPQVRETSVRAS